MSTAYEPGETGKFILPRHKDQTNPPTFIVKAMCRRLRRQWQALAAKALTAEKAKDAEEDVEKRIVLIEPLQAVYDQMIKLGVVGWENIPGDFSESALQAYMDNVLDDDDVEHFAYNWPRVFSLTGEDQKKSSSQSPSVPENSAANTMAQASA